MNFYVFSPCRLVGLTLALEGRSGNHQNLSHLISFAKTIISGLILILAFFAGEGLAETVDYQLQPGYVQLQGKQQKIPVAVADNRIERAVGLMYREKLEAGHGMLFVFDSEGEHKVWMKNVQFPLDVLFISAGGNVVSLLKNLAPCQKEPCQIYGPEAPAKYMLEINAGFIDQEAVKVGDLILFYL